MLKNKQIRTNVSKSKFLIIGKEKSRTACLKEAESKPILLAEHKLENSALEKYLGDRINEQGTAVSITETIENILPGLILG